jgi:hypothetical protein
MKSCNDETEDWRRVAYQKKEAAARGVDRWHRLPFCRRAPREQRGRSGVGWTRRSAIDAAARAAGEARCDRGVQGGASETMSIGVRRCLLPCCLTRGVVLPRHWPVAWHDNGRRCSGLRWAGARERWLGCISHAQTE